MDITSGCFVCYQGIHLYIFFRAVHLVSIFTLASCSWCGLVKLHINQGSSFFLFINCNWAEYGPNMGQCPCQSWRSVTHAGTDIDYCGALLARQDSGLTRGDSNQERFPRLQPVTHGHAADSRSCSLHLYTTRNKKSPRYRK